MARQKNKAASVRQLLLDKSRKTNESFQFLLTRYGFDRFLYRLGLSEYEPYFDQLPIKKPTVQAEVGMITPEKRIS